MADDDKQSTEEETMGEEQQTQGEDQDAMADEWEAAMEEEKAVDQAGNGSEGQGKSKGNGNGTPLSPDLDVILDIPVRISMEVGSTSITIRNLLQLNQGSVVELDRLAGEALDVLVNGTLIAHGEVVVVNEKFGIRMTDVISPSERIKKLR